MLINILASTSHRGSDNHRHTLKKQKIFPNEELDLRDAVLGGAEFAGF
jgi:hypothetical protein